jgi:hypothetical protein
LQIFSWKTNGSQQPKASIFETNIYVIHCLY